jgi:WD repeat-containing protein 68
MDPPPPPTTTTTTGSAVAAAPGTPGSHKTLVYEYTAKFPTHNISWARRADATQRLAVSSYIVEYTNKIDVLSVDPENSKVKFLSTIDHPYPPTRIMWLPAPQLEHTDLLATTGDYLRFWEYNATTDQLSMKSCLNSNDKSDFCAPLTGFDWSTEDPKVLATCSIDTTVCVWDVELQTVTSQLIAHDKEVYDINFTKGAKVFCSCGGDGSVRVFDLRSLDHCTVLYEAADSPPLLRVAWSTLDPNYVLTFAADSSAVILLDIRSPGQALKTLQGHSGPVNAIGWAPHTLGHCFTCGEDANALIWDVSAPQEGSLPDIPFLTYGASAEINCMAWAPHAEHEWVAITFGQKLQVLPV